MRYDGANELHAAQARSRLEKFIRDKKVFDLTEKKPQRTLSQNSYLHVILSYFACQYGETMEYVKREYFKKLVNSATFIREREDRFLGRIKYLRSSSDLTTEEMSLCIDRFRNWSASVAGIYLPAANEQQMLIYAQQEIERNNKFI